MKKKLSFIIEIIIGIIFICFGYFVIDTDYYATLFYAMGFGLAFASGVQLLKICYYEMPKNKEKFEKELNEKQEELDKLTEKLSSKELEIEGYKHTVEENTDKKYELQSEINAQNINYQNFEKRQAQIRQEMQSTISELDSTRLNKEYIANSNDLYIKKNNI